MLWRKGKLGGAMDDAALVSAACLGTFKWRKVAPHNSDVIHLSVESSIPPSIYTQQSTFCHSCQKGAVGASIVRSNHVGSNIETKPTVNYGQ